MLETPANAKTQIREAVAAIGTKGLDAVVVAVEDALAQAWLMERRGVLSPREVPDFIDAVVNVLKKIAPPPPKKVKFSDPLRKILPLSQENVKAATDVTLLILALSQVGDFTEVTDKKRKDYELFLDDWRRMIWESAKIADWPSYRKIAPAEDRMLEGRLSRASALAVLEATQKRRVDNISPIPDVSMLGCARCGGFRGRDRVRCHTCHGTFCTKCLGPTADLCLSDYAARYTPIDSDTRQKMLAEVRALLKEYKLDAYTRNDAFARAMKEMGIDVTFQDAAPLEGQESEGQHGRVKLLIRDRESPTTKRALFGSMARVHFKGKGLDPDALRNELFVDLCMGLQIEDALRATAAAGK
ncbi:MAG: hypothetical protein JO332_07970 [Planctomycetaceae bacterium]|nr:hypothetical protein [Planctomycetaceae bacterium]